MVIEHNLDVIRAADWIVDLGPEGGAGGGRIVAEGPPEAIAQCAVSYTGHHLKSVLEAHARRAARGNAQAAPKGGRGRGRKASGDLLG